MAGSEKPDRVERRRLREARREAKDLLAHVERLVKRHKKRLGDERCAQLGAAMAEVRGALKAGAGGPLDEARARLAALEERHLSSYRRAPGLESALSVGKVLVAVMLLRLFVLEPFKIPSGSMIPTLMIGDRLFVNKLSYGVRLPLLQKMALHWGGYTRGDVVVFVTPTDKELPILDQRDFIKRIVGLPGDVIEVRGEVLHVNGAPQPREMVDATYAYYDRLGDDGPWQKMQANLLTERLESADGGAVVHSVMRDATRYHAAREGPFVVPEGHLFMMGDNRDNSQDGRYGGWFVPFGNVKGRAIFIFYSWGMPGSWFGGAGEGLRLERLFKPID